MTPEPGEHLGDSVPAPAVREKCTVDGDPRRWRNAPLAQRVFILHNMMMKVADRQVAHLGLTSSRWLLLGAMEQFDGDPTLSELSGNALLSLQNVSRMVASMEADGLVERYTVAGKGRAVFVRMTPAGTSVIERAEDEAARFAAAFLAGMNEAETDETELRLERLITNLETFYAGLAKSDRGACGGHPDAPGCDTEQDGDS